MITVKYYGNPDKVVNDHIGNYFDMIEVSSRNFNDEVSAINFLMECTRPMTTMAEIITNNRSIKDAIEVLKANRGGYDGILNPFDEYQLN